MALFNPKSDLAQLSVFCVCGGFGFPYGTASTNRIKLIGRCLASRGIPFHVCHIGPSPFDNNTIKSGKHKGLTFEYLSPSIRRPKNIIRRVLNFLVGLLLLPSRILKCRRNIVVYVYYQGDFFNLWALFLCRLMGVPAVQEVCEWWPGTAEEKLYHDWIYKKIMFRLSVGAIPISREIQNRIRALAGAVYPMCRIPVLVDPEDYMVSSERVSSHNSVCPKLFWCGLVDGYKRDVLFLIDAMAEMKSNVGPKTHLQIAGPCSDQCRKELLIYSASKNVSPERIEILGYITDEQLSLFCSHANALLMPMWEDDRSLTRFPTKLGQYLVARRPIVTAPVGEVRFFLTQDTAMFYPAGDAKGLANCLDRLLSDLSLSERLSSRATQDVLPEVDFRENASKLSRWFSQFYSGARHV